MIQKLSTNGIGLLVLILSLIGLDVDIETINEVIAAVGVIASFIMLVKNQVSRLDVSSFIFKK